MERPSRIDEPQLVYIAGWGRSGSTLLETLLAGDDSVPIGEAFQLWSDSPLARFCSCGEPIERCPVWHHAVDAFGEPWSNVVEEMRTIRRRTLRVRHLPHLLRSRRWSGSADVERYGSVMRRVYAAVARATGARTLIDSSKLPLDLAAIAPSCPRLRVLHLVRDPRAVAASWKRDVSWDMPDGSTLRMPTHSAWGSATRWDLYHAMTSLVVRAEGLSTLRIGYEELVRLDKRAIEEVASFIDYFGLVDRARRAAAHGGLPIAVQHAIAGNPGRRSGESLELHEDDSWRRELSPGERVTVRAIALPYAAMARGRR